VALVRPLWRAAVPGLKLLRLLRARDFAASHNNRGPRWPKLSAIHVTAKVIFERFYLVPGLSTFEPRVNCLSAPTPNPNPHRSLTGYFSSFVRFLPQVAPRFFGQHDSPSNLSEYSRNAHRNAHRWCTVIR